MISTTLYNEQGVAVGKIELEPSIFGVKPNPGLIEETVQAHLANRRKAIAHTKTRADVRGGGKKPWRQKGTGRARHGSSRSPIWKGGGVTFGPRSNRVFAKKVNLKAKRAALLMVLSDKLAHHQLAVIKGVALPEPKTKHIAAFLEKFPARSRLIILPSSNTQLVRSGRNIPGLRFIRADSLNVYDTLKHQQVLVFQAALPVIHKTYHHAS